MNIDGGGGRGEMEAHVIPRELARCTLSRSSRTPSFPVPLPSGPAHRPIALPFQSILAVRAHLNATSDLPILPRP